MDHYGLIGNPVSHSLSEKYFTDKFQLEGIDARFERFLLKDIYGLPQILDAYPMLKGLSVTSPFKESVIRYCDKLDHTAGIVQAVNSLKIHRQGKNIELEGFNTDVDGFAAALLPLIGKRQADALILGSGGAARAVAHALKRLGIKYLIVSRRSKEGVVTYTDLTKDIIGSHKLIINATPLGMINYAGQAPDLPYQHISSGHLLFDLIYNPPKTPFLMEGEKAGARTVNGLVMLQTQAEMAWKIWNS